MNIELLYKDFHKTKARMQDLLYFDLFEEAEDVGGRFYAWTWKMTDAQIGWDRDWDNAWELVQYMNEQLGNLLPVYVQEAA